MIIREIYRSYYGPRVDGDWWIDALIGCLPGSPMPFSYFWKRWRLNPWHWSREELAAEQEWLIAALAKACGAEPA